MRGRLTIKNFNSNITVNADVVNVVLKQTALGPLLQFDMKQQNPNVTDVEGTKITDTVAFDTYVRWNIEVSRALSYYLAHLVDDPTAPTHAYVALAGNRMQGQFGIYSDISAPTQAFYQLVVTPQIQPTDDFILEMTVSLNTPSTYASSQGSEAEAVFWIADETDVLTSYNYLSRGDKHYIGISAYTNESAVSGSVTGIRVGSLYDQTIEDEYEGQSSGSWDVVIGKSNDTFYVSLGPDNLLVTRTYSAPLNFFIMVMEQKHFGNQYVNFQIDINRFEPV
ncbi:hypothetical protein [Thermococcus sp.]|uniref:hypothetical protein n=1 Tax=Thermococcus sp. TaxID=35749 RepID=UPI002613ABBE|nr:hypothetical protein [Thermococcus sp.]